MVDYKAYSIQRPEYPQEVTVEEDNTIKVPEHSIRSEDKLQTVTTTSAPTFSEQFRQFNIDRLAKLKEAQTNQPAILTPSGINTTEEYENVWKNYLVNNPNDVQYKALLDRLAKQESNFQNIQNKAGAGAYGYFQLWANNFKGTSGESLLKDPNSQIRHAIQLMKQNISTFTESDWELGRQKGYTKNAMLAGAWLGGVGGVRNFLTGKGDASDKHHYKNGGGESVSERMRKFNYKDGGELSNLTEIKIGNKIYHITIAKTEEEKSLGLSKHKELGNNEGMLFILSAQDKDANGYIAFTMEDTSIPLDIIFLNSAKKVDSVHKGIPKSTTPILGKGDYVLEVPTNSGISVGDVLEYITGEEDKKMLVLDSDGNTQMELVGGERIFSINNTKVLIKFAKKAQASDNDNDYKALGVRVFRFLKTQNETEPEYVSTIN